MTNRDTVLSFVQNNPGRTQQEISKALGITPEQQVNQILRALRQESLVYRDEQERPYKYYPVSASVPTTAKSFPWECAYMKYVKAHPLATMYGRERCDYPGCDRGLHTLKGRREDYITCPDRPKGCGGIGVKPLGIYDLDFDQPCPICKGLGLVHK